MTAIARKLARAVGIFGAGKVPILVSEIRKVLDHIASYDNRCISLTPGSPSKGDVLLSYINDPFYVEPGGAIPTTHTHYWESLQIAKTFLDLGYSVDVIRYSHRHFRPTKDYACVIDARTNLERLAPLLPPDCVKIMHLDTAHWLFHNTAQSRRLLELQQRRGITLPSSKIVTPNWGIEHADCATILGNGFTSGTYAYAGKPLYRIRLSTPVVYPWPQQKEFNACRKRFLWFGSAGLVHKGLDLVLEAFAEMPEYHLTVCGPIDAEKPFQEAYRKELYHTPNITTVGWVDISSRRFTEIADSCLALVYPSCSEGGGGSVITCMHAGLIPLVSYESSVDLDKDYGVLFSDCSIQDIQHNIRMISSLPANELKRMSQRAWEFVRTNHTREQFAEDFRHTMGSILARFRREQPVVSSCS